MGRIVPALWQEPITASFGVLRPATQQRDYIIEALSKEKWIRVRFSVNDMDVRCGHTVTALGKGGMVEISGTDGPHAIKERGCSRLECMKSRTRHA